MGTLLIGFIKLCIFLGETVLFLLNQLGKFILFLLLKFRSLLSKVFETIYFFPIKIYWALFKRKKVKKKRFFSLSRYLVIYKIKYFIFGFIIAILVLGLKTSIDFIDRLPNPSLVENSRAVLSTHIYSRSGEMLYEIYHEQNRTPVKLAELPQHITWATLAIEDKDFYSHSGVSILGGIARAIKETVLEKKLQGGSTITQQLVKSALLTPERTIQRKTKEIILALLVERKYAKDEILEMYLNQVPYGGTAWGIEEASRLYFGKPAQELNLSEAALLAGLPQAPSAYSPYTNPKAAKARQAQVLKNMAKEGYITKKSFKQAMGKKIAFKKPTQTIKAPHFVFYVKNLLEKEYGLKTVQEGGLRVYTTLDYSIQKKAEKILKQELDNLEGYQVGNGAILVTQPSTGEILSMVGSRDFFEGEYGAFNVTTALRQPGSSIKPITYTLALKNGMTAASIIQDTPVVFQSAGAEAYRPVNYDNRFHGAVPLRYALANSYNVPAVKILQQVGVDNLINFAEKLGIQGWSENGNRYGLSLTLGGGEVTMLDMATAFGTIRNLGVKTELNPILRIENSIGQILYESEPERTRVINEGEPYVVSDILSDNIARTWAFGANSPLNFGNGHISVKTGTTDEKKDNWTIGFTRPTYANKHGDALVAVWVGNNDNRPMNPRLTSGITGAAPIWRNLIEQLVSKDFFEEQLYVPEKVEKKICYFGRVEYFVNGTSRAVNCFDYKLTPPPTKKSD